MKFANNQKSDKFDELLGDFIKCCAKNLVILDEFFLVIDDKINNCLLSYLQDFENIEN